MKNMILNEKIHTFNFIFKSSNLLVKKNSTGQKNYVIIPSLTRDVKTLYMGYQWWL